MESGKADNSLNLALSLTDSERTKLTDLELGLDPETNEWELIVKYNGSLRVLADRLGFRAVELLNGYGVILINENKIQLLVAQEEIEFVENPKRLYFEAVNGSAASCISAVQGSLFNLSGKGVLVAVIDSGIDYAHPDFRNSDGTTRILYLWDQTIQSNISMKLPLEGDIQINQGTEEVDTQIEENTGDAVGTENEYPLITGTIYTEKEINQALSVRNRAEQLEIVPSVDTSGHGTHVTGIAAGNGRASNGINKGVAFDASLIIVKLGRTTENSFPRTTQLMTAVDFVVRKSLELRMPLAINISFGNNYGAHESNSILEQYLNDVSNIWKNCVVVGTGNEGSGRSHASGILRTGMPEIVELAVSEAQFSFSLQIWKNFYDAVEVSLIHPSGEVIGPIPSILGPQRFRLDNTEILLYYGEPKPMYQTQEIFIEFLPFGTNQTVDTGIWKFRLAPGRVISGNYDMWLPVSESLNPGTGFIRPSEETTLTIPSTASRVISVGAYNSNTDSVAYFSGRGFTRGNGFIKPDLVAPGVNINSASPGGGYSVRSGTSMATPFVTGSCALMMQWGILEGNDPYLYGQKVKAYLINGARQLTVIREYPSPLVGYGALCLRNSIPV